MILKYKINRQYDYTTPCPYKKENNNKIIMIGEFNCRVCINYIQGFVLHNEINCEGE